MYRCTNLSFIKPRSSRTRRLFGSTMKSNSNTKTKIAGEIRILYEFGFVAVCRIVRKTWVRCNRMVSNSCIWFFLHPIGYLRNSVYQHFPSWILNIANAKRIHIQNAQNSINWKMFETNQVQSSINITWMKIYDDESSNKFFCLFVDFHYSFLSLLSINSNIRIQLNGTRHSTLKKCSESSSYGIRKKNLIIIQFDPLIYQLPFLIFLKLKRHPQS